MKKKGFTLVELLAVIAILAILVILALPNVIGLYNSAKQETFLTEVKSLASSAEKQYMSNQLKGDNNRTFSSNGNKLETTGKELQYCIILKSNGKISELRVSNGTWIVTLPNGKSVSKLTKSNLAEGSLTESDLCISNIPEPVYCTIDEKIEKGSWYSNGQYTYRYMYDSYGYGWSEMNVDGWGVVLTDLDSTDPVTSDVCTYINGKPVVSMEHMFHGSKATSIDVSKVNTENVISMSAMFDYSNATEIKGLENFDTSNVTDMSHMFRESKVKKINVSKMNTENVTDMSYMFIYTEATEIKGLENFDTSNVTDMESMFYSSMATNLDVSNFDTSNVTNMAGMFRNSRATEIKGLENLDTSNVEWMWGMLGGTSVPKINVLKWNIDNVKNHINIFCGAAATEIKGQEKFGYDPNGDSSQYCESEE